MYLKMLSAVCFKLDQSKILSSCNGLTLSQLTNFTLVQTERICRHNFKFDRNAKKFSKKVENTGKRRIYSH